jgi:hypothetical protein
MTFKLTCSCGMPMIQNPHPDAGKADHYQDVGATHECIPCLVKNRKEWEQRSQAAENRIAELEALLGKARDKPIELRDEQSGKNSLASLQRLEKDAFSQTSKRPIVQVAILS